MRRFAVLTALVAVVFVGACQTTSSSVGTGSTELVAGSYSGVWRSSSRPGTADSTLNISEVTETRVVGTYVCRGCGGNPYYSRDFDVPRNGNSFSFDVTGGPINLATTDAGGIRANFGPWGITYSRRS